MKGSQQAQALSINTNLNNQFQHSEKSNKQQPNSAKHQHEKANNIRQSMTLSPKMTSG